MPGTTSIAGRTSIRTRWAASPSSDQSDPRSAAPDGGCQSTRRTGTPWAPSAEAKSSGPTTTAPRGARRSSASDDIAPLSDRARGLGGDPIARAHDGAELRELLLLPLEALRVLVCPDDVRDDRQVAPAATRAGLGERRTQRTGGIRMSAVAEHEIEQQHGRARIVPGGDDGGVPLAGIDDRMGPPARELLGAEIDEPVRRRIDDEAPRFVTEGPAGEEADNRAAAAGGRPPRPVEGAHAAGGQLHRGGRALLERR